MFDRIATSFSLARSSWDVLRKDKQLLLFPILSGIGFLLVVASFLVPLGVVAYLGGFKDLFDQNGDLKEVPWWSYVVLFAFYFCNYFVVIFCNSALVSCALMRFNGEAPTLGDGFRSAATRLPQILAWAVVSATVGLLLKLIESTHRRAGEFISAILGTAWSVMTYFVVPVLVVEKVGPFQAVGRSIALMRATWGEALVGHFGLGFFKFLAVLPLFVLIAVGVALCVAANGAAPLLVGGVAVFVIAGVYFLLYLAVAAAMDTIFLTALYQYAAFQTVPVGFESDSMQRAFQTKR